MKELLIGFLFAFAIGMILGPIVIMLARKLKAGQSILHYVTAHKQKEGTPTLGGLIFIIATAIILPILMDGQASLAVIALAVFLGYGLLGFLDDFIKIRTHNNLGLRAYQKIIGQVGIAVIVAVFAYKSGLVGTEIYLPWALYSVDIGWGIIPLVIFVFLAMTNSANLTDGLDGLAGGVSFVSLLAVSALIMITQSDYLAGGGGQAMAQEYGNLALLGTIAAGGVLAFLCFNAYPAKIFMGDTGSLSLGGLIAALGVFSGQELALPIICTMFVVSAVSVIVQVLHYKRTKRRILLMAPLHHHFEQKGVNETKIVAIYIITTIISGTLAVLLCLL